jgi:hypothetical protein
MNPPNPPANLDPSCAVLVETAPDPDKGPSTALLCALCDGYAPGPSWLVTKEGGEQAIVVLLTRPSRVGVVPPSRVWPLSAGVAFLAAFLAVVLAVGGWCVALAVVLR